MAVDSWDPTRDGELTEQALREKLERKGYSVSRYVYPPGTFFDTHTHGVDKIDGVLAGRFELTLPEGSVVLEAGDAIEVPRGAPHSAKVIGDEAVVSLDAIRY